MHLWRTEIVDDKIRTMIQPDLTLNFELLHFLNSFKCTFSIQNKEYSGSDGFGHEVLSRGGKMSQLFPSLSNSRFHLQNSIFHLALSLR